MPPKVNPYPNNTIIDLDKEYSIVIDFLGVYLSHNGHISQEPPDEVGTPYCKGIRCTRKVPYKIWTMYKLWKFHNE